LKRSKDFAAVPSKLENSKLFKLIKSLESRKASEVLAELAQPMDKLT